MGKHLVYTHMRTNDTHPTHEPNGAIVIYGAHTRISLLVGDRKQRHIIMIPLTTTANTHT